MLTVLRRLVRLIQLFPDRGASEHGGRVRVSSVGDRPGGAGGSGAGGAGGHCPPVTGQKGEHHEYDVSAGHRRGGGGAGTGDRGGDPPVTDRQERRVIP